MRLPTCALCGREVLELHGQFQLNDSHLLEPDDPEDAPIGWMHLPCLLETPWGTWWAERKRANRAARRLSLVGSAPGLVAHRTTDRREVLIVREDGLDLHLLVRDIARARPTDGGVLVPVSGQYNLHLEGHDALAREIAARIAGGGCALPWIVDELALRDRLFEPRALEGGQLVADPRFPVLTGSSVSGVLSYAQFVPQPMWALVANVA